MSVGGDREATAQKILRDVQAVGRDTLDCGISALSTQAAASFCGAKDRRKTEINPSICCPET